MSWESYSGTEVQVPKVVDVWTAPTFFETSLLPPPHIRFFFDCSSDETLSRPVRHNPSGPGGRTGAVVPPVRTVGSFSLKGFSWSSFGRSWKSVLETYPESPATKGGR